MMVSNQPETMGYKGEGGEERMNEVDIATPSRLSPSVSCSSVQARKERHILDFLHKGQPRPHTHWRVI